MHTFFINTTEKNMDNYPEILEIYRENSQVITLDYPLRAWGTGVEECVKKIGELIDNYKDINNSYNLIVYIDLIEFDKYLAEHIDMGDDHLCAAALYVRYLLFRHYIRATLYDSLAAIERRPHETLIIFEENPGPADKQIFHTEDGKAKMRSMALKLLGLPSEEETVEFEKKYDESHGDDFDLDVFISDFKEHFKHCEQDAIIGGIGKYYNSIINAWHKEIAGGGENPVMEATSTLVAELVKRDNDDKYSIEYICLQTNRTANDINRQERARRDLRLYLFLIDCIETGTLYCDRQNGDNAHIRMPKEFPVFADSSWKKIGDMLNKKCAVYNDIYLEISSSDTDFSSLGLAPAIIELDHEMFGYDEVGRVKTDLIYEDYEVKREEENKDNNDNNAQDGSADDDNDGQSDKNDSNSESKKIAGGSVAVTEIRRQIPAVLSKYKPFEGYKGASEAPKITAKDANRRFIEEADKLKKHHINLLPRLKRHVSDTLSDYASRSVEGRPAKLSKRRVSVADEHITDEKYRPRYNNKGTLSTQAVVTVKESADSFYAVAQREYLEFCAARSVAVTDIEEIHEWFVNKVGEITASLKKIHKVGIIIALAAMLLYIPYWVIQWEAIVENVATLVTALNSTVIPLAILAVIIVILGLRQRLKYRQAWKEFKSKSDMILESNVNAMRKFDQLLAIIIPSLRYIYEFKLDVEFANTCHKMLSAKRDHHGNKLYKRIEMIANMLEDLELEYRGSDNGPVAGNTSDKIEFGLPFCVGEKNIKLYSIFDCDMTNEILKEGAGD